MTEGSTALVTGANRGIGQQVARDLAGLGWNVLVAARDKAKGEAAASRVKKEGRGKVRVRWEALDVADEASVAALAERLAKAKIRLGALVNNAGIYGESHMVKRWKETVDVNFYGALRVTDALAPLLDDGANVVMVSSGIGDLANVAPSLRKRLSAPDLDRAGLLEIVEHGLQAAEAKKLSIAGFPADGYCFSKACLNALTRVLAKEHPSWRVSSVCPGWVRTDMGGRNAPRSVEEGAAGVTWAATLTEGPSGVYYRDTKPIPF